MDGQLAVARAFGDRSLKVHLSSEPDVVEEMIDDGAEPVIPWRKRNMKIVGRFVAMATGNCKRMNST